MENNLDGLKELVATLKADQLAHKEKEKRDAWTKYVSLSMIFLAVLAAVASQRSAGSSSTTMKELNEATFNQAAASDQWSYYQAKGIKQSLYEIDRDRVQGADAKQAADLASHIERYDKEKKEIADVAKGFEQKRDDARAKATHAARQGNEMGLAGSIFQIAIALGGVTLVVKKRWLWYASLLTGVLATVQMLKVFLAG